MATDNKQKVLIRSMSVEELMDYLCTSDLNGKITPKNEDTWHQNYDHTTSHYHVGAILSNKSKGNLYVVFFNRSKYNNYILTDLKEIRNYINFSQSNPGGSGEIYVRNYFRPLIEYKE